MGRYYEAIDWYEPGASPKCSNHLRGPRTTSSGSSSSLESLPFASGKAKSASASGGATRSLPGRSQRTTRNDSRPLTCSFISRTRSWIAQTVAYRGLASPIYEELGNLQGQAIALNNLGSTTTTKETGRMRSHVYERSRGPLRTHRRRHERRHGDQQHRRDPVRPGKPRRGATELFHTVRRTIDPNRIPPPVDGESPQSRPGGGHEPVASAEADELLSEAADGFHARSMHDQLRGRRRPRPYRRGRCSRRRPGAGTRGEARCG